MTKAYATGSSRCEDEREGVAQPSVGTVEGSNSETLAAAIDHQRLRHRLNRDYLVTHTIQAS